MALAAGAESVTTIEYNKLAYDHPRISTVTNAEWYVVYCPSIITFL